MNERMSRRTFYQLHLMWYVLYVTAVNRHALTSLSFFLCLEVNKMEKCSLIVGVEIRKGFMTIRSDIDSFGQRVDIRRYLTDRHETISIRSMYRPANDIKPCFSFTRSVTLLLIHRCEQTILIQKRFELFSL